MSVRLARARGVSLLVAMMLSHNAPASSSATPSSGTVAPSNLTPQRGVLIWKGHWFTGAVRVAETESRGSYVIFADSLDARPLVVRSITISVGRSPSATRTLKEPSPGADSLLRIATRVYAFEELAVAAYIRLRDQNAGDRQIADSLDLLAARFADALDSVRVESHGFAEYRHGDADPWGVAVNLAPIPKPDPRASAVEGRAASFSGEINEQLQQGRSVVVWGNGGITVLPQGGVQELYGQLSALRAGRVPRDAVIYDSTSLRQLLVPEPLEPEGGRVAPRKSSH